MKKLLSILCICILQISFAQVIKDLDGDQINDTARFNKDVEIVVKLSSQNFKPMISKEHFEYGAYPELRSTKSGFEYAENFMRGGFAIQFRYEPKDKKIRLIGMRRFEFGPANNDGSGESSVNLLTNQYIGDWNYWDEEDSELKKIPTIRKKMVFPKVYLDGNIIETFETYQEKCSNWFNAEKKRLLKF